MGKFIVFEGLDGSGTSTQARLLAERCKENGIDHLLEKEPNSDHSIGKILREEFLSGKMRTNRLVGALLFLADRIDHFYHEDHGLARKLMSGINVIQDRYHLSWLSYNKPKEFIDGFSEETMLELSRLIFAPDLTIYLAVSPEQAMARIKPKQSQAGVEIFDSLEEQMRVRVNYERAIINMRLEGWNIIVINGTLSIESIANKVWTEVSNLLRRNV
jgi:dTMP kinase